MSAPVTGPARRRHCMVVHAYYPLTETRVRREAEGLVRSGYEVDVVCPRQPGEPARERYRGVEVHRLPARIDKRSLARQFLGYVHFFVLATIWVARLHRRRRYSTVQVHNLPDFLVFCAIVPKLQRVPVILDLHDLMPEFFAGRFGTGKRRFLSRVVAFQERAACRFADHVITVSHHWRDTLVRRGVGASKCSVVMNVADESVFTPVPRPVARSGRFELVYHGTVAYRYGLDLVLEAIARLKDRVPALHLTVIGRGDQMADLVALRERLGIGRHVDLRDEYVVADQLPAILGPAALGVVAYRNDVFTDGLVPTKLMEYAVMGIPCVASRTTAIAAYFDGAMVDFCEPGAPDALARAIERLYADPVRRRRLSRNARRFTERYNWERIGAEYVQLVSKLGDRVRGPSAPFDAGARPVRLLRHSG